MAEELYEQIDGLFGHRIVPAVQTVIDVILSAIGNISRQVMRQLRSLVSPLRPPSITGAGTSFSQQQLSCYREVCPARALTQRQPATASANGFGALADLPSAYDFSANQPSVPSFSGLSTQVTEEQEEDEIRFVHNSQNHDSVPYGSSNEESGNMAQSDVNVETVNLNEDNTEHQPDEMLMDDDEENVDDESQDEPTITVVNYEEEFEAQFNDNTHNQDFVPDGSLDEESLNVSQEEANGITVDSLMIDSNEDDHEHLPGQEVLDDQENRTEASNERDQAGPSIVPNPESTLTRRSARVSAAKKANNSETMENSVINQQAIMQTETRKRKQPNKLTDNVPGHKRLRVEPVVVSYDEEDEAEEETLKLSVTLLNLKCPEKGCKTKKNFSNKVQLNEHLLAKHRIEKYRCHLKGCATVSFATHAELKDHRKTAHRKLKSWPCAHCATICTSFKDLGTHFSENHQVGSFGCTAERCTFTEKTRKRVRNHQESKHRQRKYRCTFAGCTASFNRSSHRTDHLLLHAQERPFPCDECSKAYTQKSHLTVHKRSHSGLKPYHCGWPQCDFSASDLSNAKGHVRTVHFGLPRTKKEQAERQIIDTRDAGQFVRKVTDN